jgi:hypothetical protein
MSTGLYQDHFIVERFQATPSAQTITQKYVAPADLDVLGLILVAGTAPGTSAVTGLTVNVSNTPTSQTGGPGASVAPYNLWTAANVATLANTATTNLTVVQSNTFFGAQQLVQNSPYALNYPLPGPSGTVGYVTAQATSQTTEVPVTSPPVVYRTGITGYGAVAPDNTYTDYNSIAGTPASVVRAGDVLSFVIAALSNGIGAAANLNIELVASKR